MGESARESGIAALYDYFGDIHAMGIASASYQCFDQLTFTSANIEGLAQSAICNQQLGNGVHVST